MKLRDFLLLVLVCLLWAGNNILSKLVITHLHVPPLFFTAVRFAIVSLVTLRWLLPMPHPAWRIVTIGLTMGAGSFGLMFVALLWASPSEAAIVVQSSVPMTTLLSIWLLGERIRWRRGIGITLALVGVLIVVWQPGVKVSAGMGFLLASALCGSLGAVLMKQMGDIAPLQFQAWVGLVGLLALAPASAVVEPHAWEAARAAGWWFIAAACWAALVTSVFAHTAYYFLIGKYEANLVSPLTLMTPLLTIAFGIAITGDHFDARMALGSAVALAGVLIVALRSGNRAIALVEEHS
ncbi:MAG: DMT family transporter [Novosphingobium sp.]